MGDNNVYKQAVADAYSSVSDLDAESSFKLEGFKIVLNNILGDAETAQTAPKARSNDNDIKRNGSTVTHEAWASTIGNAIGLTQDQVLEIYHYEEDSLRLVIDRKQLPDTASAATVDIAGLISAGRQALGLDNDGTPYDTIRIALEQMNCFNKKNWTGYIKKLGGKFIYEGSNSTARLKLTHKAFGQVGDIAKTYLEEA